MADQISAIIADLEGVAESVIIDLTLEMTANLVEDTPIDIGWARANWIPAIGSPPILAQSGDPDAGDVSIAVSRQSSGQAEVLTYKIDSGPVFVSNNAPYIRRLNDGWSKQAPAGFVQISMERAISTVMRSS